MFGLVTSLLSSRGGRNCRQDLARIFYDDQDWADVPLHRLATHNVGGLTSLAKLTALVSFWHAAALDVICVQEIWAGRPGRGGRSHSEAQLHLWLVQAAQACGLPPYYAAWASNTASPEHNAGVLVLARPSPHLSLSHPRGAAHGRGLLAAAARQRGRAWGPAEGPTGAPRWSSATREGRAGSETAEGGGKEEGAPNLVTRGCAIV